MFKTILAATDRVTGGDAPVLTAMDLAERYRAKLYILHVLEPVSPDRPDQMVPSSTWGETRGEVPRPDTAKQALEHSYPPVPGMPEPPVFLVGTGNPVEEILRIGREVDADLMVVGPHCANSPEKTAPRVTAKIGSTAQGVIAREHCPVMIVSRPVRKEKLEFKKIVVGIDFSVSCECALCLSVRLSRNFGSTLYPFFMLPVPPYPKYSRSDYTADKEVLTRKLEEFCDIYLDGIDHDYRIWAGALPHKEVLTLAEEIDADLIMLGSHTKKSNGKWYAGSVVEKVSLGANCPVLSVNDPQALEKWEDIRVRVLDGEAPVDRSIHLFTGKAPGQKP